MADTPVLSDFVSQQIKSGVQGIVIGEEHTSVSLPNLLSAQMAAFKAAGVQTLFVEHVPGNRQPMLQDALNGKPAAQHELYTHMLGNWHTDEAATSRYNMMFAAHAAGIKVVGIDTASSNEHLMRASHSRVNEMRFTMGDAFMAREVLRAHGDQPFMVLAGSAHVGKDGETSVLSSAHGSIDKRLTAAGVKSIAIFADAYFDSAPDFAVMNTDQPDPDSVYQLSVPDKHNAGVAPSNAYVRAGTGLRYLRDNFAHLVKDSGSVVSFKDLRDAQKQLDAASSAFNACADASKLASLYAPVTTFTNRLVPEGHDEASYYLREVVESMANMLGNDSVETARPEMCKPGAEAKWLRPAAKPMGSTHN